MPQGSKVSSEIAGASPAPARQRNRDLLTGSIAPTLLLFALPTLASSALQSVSGSINAIWVGRFLGEDALAATANGNIVMFLMISFVFGFGMAATILIGQSWGRSDIDTARRIVGTTAGAFVPIAVVICIAGWIFAPDLLTLLGTPEGSYEFAVDYLQVIFLAMPGTMSFTLLMMALRGTGDSVTPLWFMGLLVVLDSGLNPLLIDGMGPFPRLGIAGAAMATTIATYTSLIALLVYLYRKDLPLRLRGAELGYLKPEWSMLKRIVSTGLPIGLQMIVITTAALSMLRLINQQGVDTTAAYAVTQQIWTYVQMPAMALGAAVSAMAAQNIGAGQWDRVSRITRWGVVFAIVLTTSLIVLLLLIEEPLLGLFLGADSPSLPIARHIGLLATWGFVAFAVGLVLFGTVRANGTVIGPLMILFIGMYPVRLGFAVGARDWLGVDAIWWSFPVAMVAIMFMAMALYLQGSWRTKGIGRQAFTPPTVHECTEQCRTIREPAGTMAPP